MNNKVKPQLLLALFFSFIAQVTVAEELLGDPALEGSDFPRRISGYIMYEDEYAIYVRECGVALYIMERPVADMEELSITKAIKFFILGAQSVSARNINFDQYVDMVKETCGSNPSMSLAAGVLATSDLIDQ